MANFDSANVSNLVGLWDFRAGSETSDTGLDDGIAQNGQLENGASVSGDQAHFGAGGLLIPTYNDRFDVDGGAGATTDAPFDMARGTIEVQFTQDHHVGTSPDTVVSRGEFADLSTEGYFGIQILSNGAIQVIHCVNGQDSILTTSPGIVSADQEVNVTYSWDAATGVTLQVENLSSGLTDTISSNTTGLTMEIGDNDDENFTFGARESDDSVYDQHFAGSIDYVAIYEEKLPEPDGAVDGEDFGELMEIGYDDGEGPTDQGGDVITNDADLIFGNGGNDTIDGAGGNDTIYGDNAPASGSDAPGEIFSWAAAPGFANLVDTSGFTQDTGSAQITFSVTSSSAGAVTEFETEHQNTSQLDPEVGETSSLQSITNGAGGFVDYRWDSENGTIENIEFRINDIDGDGTVRVEAFDAFGNPVGVILSDAGSGLVLTDSNTISGNDTATSTDNNFLPDSAAEHSVLVSIAGPVAYFTVSHDQFDTDNSGINITDITFSPSIVMEDADDSIDGGTGDDLIFGQQGDDTVSGGEGNDTIYGDNAPETPSGPNLIVNGSFEDTTGMTATSYGFVDFGSVPGWTSYDNFGNVVNDQIDFHSDGRGGITASDGNNWLDLEGTGANLRIGQDIPDLAEGETYRLTFGINDFQNLNFASEDPNVENFVEVYWNGTLVDQIDPGNVGTDVTWDDLTFDLVAGPGDNRLEFRGTGQLDNIGASVDNVQLFLLGAGEDSLSGNDDLSGNDGSDVIYGQGGDDTITGGADADILSGGDDADVFIGGTDGDVVDGGAGGDDFDTLDLRGLGAIEIADEVLDADGNSTSGTINFLDTGGSMTFSEIEEILSDPVGPGTDGPVDGLDDGEEMLPGYTDGQGDQIDGADGINDTIFGNGGDDTIDSGNGDDIVDGGDGDDTFVLTGGMDQDTIIGGEGDETDGDTLDASDFDTGEGLDLVLTAPETGTITEIATGETTEFSEIENFILGAGDDTVSGSDGNDNVNSGGGDDFMEGGEGNDTLTSGDGLDTIYGGGGDDSLVGGDEADELYGDEGDDTLIGGSGPDTLDGGTGDDSLLGGADNDSIIGGDGNDVVEDLGGNNIIDTSGGDNLPDIGFPAYGPFPAVPADSDPDDDRDFVTTGSGNDSITTGDDADTIVSGGGNDTIDSGIDDDYVEAGSGADLVTTGEGNDTVFGGDGNDTIYGGLGPSFPSGIDIPDAPGTGLFGPDPEPDNGRDYIDGGRGNDVIYGEDDDDTLIGGLGADTLDGGIDDDLLQGGVGQDDMIGGQGADTMEGGDDRDFFIINERTDAFGDVIDGGTGGNDVDRLTLTGLGRFEIVDQTTDADGDSTSGTVNFLDALGNIEGSLVFSEIENLVICFTPGTAVATPRGEIDVANLQVGDRVITRDNGVQEISWIGRKKLGAADLIADPKLRPVLIKKGSLGNNLPERDMMVSPNHRMLMANSQTQVLFDEREVLVASKYLVGQPGIHQLDTLGVEYVHVMFENHEVILGDGTWTESFQPGDHSLSGIDEEQREEIFRLFPSLQNEKGRRAYSSARQSLKAHEAKMLRETMGLV